MKKTLFAIWIVMGLLAAGRVWADEVSLYDQNGNAVAYVADDSTIYIWNGDPVAYLFEQDSRVSIYAFNGTHLGWVVGGIVYDRLGNAQGFQKGATVNIFPGMESAKGIKANLPPKFTREYPPVTPTPTGQWSTKDFESFLRNEAR